MTLINHRLFIGLLFPLVLLFTSPLIAQSSESDKQQYDAWNGDSKLFLTKNNNVKGSQYFSDDWVDGKVILDNKSITKKLKLNYNIYEQKVVFKEGDELRAYDPDKIKGFIILDDNGNVETQFANGFYDENLNIGPSDLMRVVYSGDTKLLAKHEVFFDQNSSRDPFSNAKYSEYKESVTYYLLTEHIGLTKTRLKRNPFIETLGTHEKDLKEYAKAARLKIKNEREARTLLYYYDSINK
ncbi:hypothetical protein SAMN06265219_10145 [Gracilimonas mengyeensis]|uniref:Uncharacterized protein n=2 Tax=Gracilimonas mengyeensis TaxID=1302730 RepID=A0A521ACA0_9BACT|nr:hypothetical protein SAMN06265219_10145 [Gracilimonas mengyeensis]